MRLFCMLNLGGYCPPLPGRQAFRGSIHAGDQGFGAREAESTLGYLNDPGDTCRRRSAHGS